MKPWPPIILIPALVSHGLADAGANISPAEPATVIPQAVYRDGLPTDNPNPLEKLPKLSEVMEKLIFTDAFEKMGFGELLENPQCRSPECAEVIGGLAGIIVSLAKVPEPSPETALAIVAGGLLGKACKCSVCVPNMKEYIEKYQLCGPDQGH
ncbi:hypothetical protein F5Y15DRAFT_419317 [Xylariaceae sp. FL0016]|nr:hypothetical protein F5Y15DRAFT_419317 [Xylariaceae sp. FL0016]